ncbi:hypothetical protein ALC56_07141 [Trachymyrmex septentrionalis]|uniref:Uncharacterized protein n=1 Tax=Trachymyrmex septentrionalis TaxID=34720 RepID=A0A151JW80_9HYME|nr:hypothetical protein ALC56_07141 [Trachymyrmex septentrionalis]
MPVFDVKITVLEELKPLTTRSFTNSGLTINTNRLMFLWGYVDRCLSLLYDVYDLFISTTTYR